MRISGRQTIQNRANWALFSQEPTDNSGMVCVKPEAYEITGASGTYTAIFGETKTSFSNITSLKLFSLFDEEYEFYTGILTFTVSTAAYVHAYLVENLQSDYFMKYRYQWMYGSGNAAYHTESPFDSDRLYVTYSDSSTRTAMVVMHVYSPYSSSTTTGMRSVSSSPYNGSWNDIIVSSNFVQEQNDGIYIYPSAGTMSGEISWYAHKG